MLAYGKISEINTNTGLARVAFDDDGIVSGWLEVFSRKTKGAKETFPFDIQEHVACLMDQYKEHGVIIAAVYDKNNKPSLTNKNVYGIEYDNGDLETYNKQTKTKKITAGTAEIQIKTDGIVIKVGTETLLAVLSDTLTQISAITVPGNLGYPTGVPINAPAFAAIIARIQLLLA